MTVCITGMHRSGTSLIASLLREAGLYLGDEADLIPASKDNVDGFWEFAPFVEISDRALERLGGWWDCVPPLQRQAEPGLLVDLRQAAKAAAQKLQARANAGWKDPRASLLLPFWRSVLPVSRVVICLRNPLEVARSMQKRNGTSLAFGLKLWWVYAQQLLADTTPAERLVTHFDAYFHDPRTELRRLLAFVGLPTDDATLDACCRRVTAGSRHNRLGVQDLFNAGAAPALVALYQQLCAEAGWLNDMSPLPPAGVVAAAEQTVQHELVDAIPVLQVGVPAFDRLQLLTAEVTALRARLASQEQDISDLRSALAGQDVSSSAPELQRALAAEKMHKEQVAADVVERERLQQELRDFDLRVKERDAKVHQELREFDTRVKERDQKLVLAAAREAELKQMLLDAHDQLLRRDEEIAAMIAQIPVQPAAGAAKPSTANPASYVDLVGRIRQAACSVMPEGSVACVISKGDEALVQLQGRTGWHFPRDEAGGYAGYSPKDSADATVRLEAEVARGARFVIIPSTSKWWLDHYADWAAHLKKRGAAVVDNADCTIFDLVPAKAASVSTGRRRKSAVNGHKRVGRA